MWMAHEPLQNWCPGHQYHDEHHCETQNLSLDGIRIHNWVAYKRGAIVLHVNETQPLQRWCLIHWVLDVWCIALQDSVLFNLYKVLSEVVEYGINEMKGSLWRPFEAVSKPDGDLDTPADLVWMPTLAVLSTASNKPSASLNRFCSHPDISLTLAHQISYQHQLNCWGFRLSKLTLM